MPDMGQSRMKRKAHSYSSIILPHHKHIHISDIVNSQNHCPWQKTEKKVMCCVALHILIRHPSTLWQNQGENGIREVCNPGRLITVNEDYKKQSEEDKVWTYESEWSTTRIVMFLLLLRFIISCSAHPARLFKRVTEFPVVFELVVFMVSKLKWCEKWREKWTQNGEQWYKINVLYTKEVPLYCGYPFVLAKKKKRIHQLYQLWRTN